MGKGQSPQKMVLGKPNKLRQKNAIEKKKKRKMQLNPILQLQN